MAVLGWCVGMAVKGFRLEEGDNVVVIHGEEVEITEVNEKLRQPTDTPSLRQPKRAGVMLDCLNWSLLQGLAMTPIKYLTNWTWHEVIQQGNGLQ